MPECFPVAYFIVRLLDASVENDNLRDEDVTPVDGRVSSTGSLGADEDTFDAADGALLGIVAAERPVAEMPERFDAAVDGLDHFSSFSNGCGGTVVLTPLFRAAGGACS